MLDDEGMLDQEFNIMAGKVDGDSIDILDFEHSVVSYGKKQKNASRMALYHFYFHGSVPDFWWQMGGLRLDDTTLALISYL
jgi:hypothetical protein